MSEQPKVEMPENIVSTTADEIRSKIKEALDGDPSGLVLDLEQTKYVDSMGIGVLIAAFNSTRQKQIDFQLINVDKEIHELFSTMRLDQHFGITPREEQ